MDFVRYRLYFCQIFCSSSSQGSSDQSSVRLLSIIDEVCHFYLLMWTWDVSSEILNTQTLVITRLFNGQDIGCVNLANLLWCMASWTNRENNGCRDWSHYIVSLQLDFFEMDLEVLNINQLVFILWNECSKIK